MLYAPSNIIPQRNAYRKHVDNDLTVLCTQNQALLNTLQPDSAGAFPTTPYAVTTKVAYMIAQQTDALKPLIRNKNKRIDLAKKFTALRLKTENDILADGSHTGVFETFIATPKISIEQAYDDCLRTLSGFNKNSADMLEQKKRKFLKKSLKPPHFKKKDAVWTALSQTAQSVSNVWIGTEWINNPDVEWNKYAYTRHRRRRPAASA